MSNKSEQDDIVYLMNKLESLLMRNHDYKYGISDDELDMFLEIIKDAKKKLEKRNKNG